MIQFLQSVMCIMSRVRYSFSSIIGYLLCLCVSVLPAFSNLRCRYKISPLRKLAKYRTTELPYCKGVDLIQVQRWLSQNLTGSMVLFNSFKPPRRIAMFNFFGDGHIATNPWVGKNETASSSSVLVIGMHLFNLSVRSAVTKVLNDNMFSAWHLIVVPYSLYFLN